MLYPLGGAGVTGFTRAAALSPFIMEVDTTLAGGTDAFSVPTVGAGYNATINWGDGEEEVILGTPGAVSHTYDSGGVYDISITENVMGGFPRIYFNNAGDREKITDIKQWGTSPWTSMDDAFEGCNALTAVTATDTPDMSSCSDMSNMFGLCSSMTSIDLTDMDASGVTTMGSMFTGCSSLTTLLATGWDVSNVTTMIQAFWGCTSLVSLDLSGWITTENTNLQQTFFNCNSLETIDFTGWNTSKVTTMLSMFESAASLVTADLSMFDTSSVLNMDSVFKLCADLLSIGVVTGWDVSKVTTMEDMFRGCSSLVTLNLSGWDNGEVLTMKLMFHTCGSLTTLNVSGWNTVKVTDMVQMFINCFVLDVNVSGFNITALTSASGMMSGTAFSQTNYDLLLPAWDAYGNTNGVPLHAGAAEYGAGAPATAHADMLTDGWIFTDGGPA